MEKLIEQNKFGSGDGDQTPKEDLEVESQTEGPKVTEQLRTPHDTQPDPSDENPETVESHQKQREVALAIKKEANALFVAQDFTAVY